MKDKEIIDAILYVNGECYDVEKIQVCSTDCILFSLCKNNPGVDKNTVFNWAQRIKNNNYIVSEDLLFEVLL